MYNGCFGLNRRPFVAVPQVDYYFAADAIEGARNTLTRCIQRGEGAGLVIGPSGTGKTLLCLMLAEQFRQSFQVAMLSSGRLSSRRALFQAILYELGRPYRGMDEGELRLAVTDHLVTNFDELHGMVLLVDEAHTLPLRLLEEIRLLTNLAQKGQPLVRLLLAGGPALEERLASPKLDSFSQRLTARCYLEAFNRTETQDYIQAQILAAGGQGELVFPEKTCLSVYQATGGVPRLVNQLCDHALLLAYAAGRKQIDPAGVDEAWADLQQLPAPMNAEPSDTSSEGVIEFGSLDDSDEGEPGEISQPTVFRVAEVDEETDEVVDEAEASEPGNQLHRIEQLLAEADDETEEFRPAGAIVPEVDLYFAETSHPFEEEFEQEEVVADRYAATAVAVEAPPKAVTTIAEPVAAPPAAAAVATRFPAPSRSTEQPTQAPTTRRREYRQLFAQLLRG